MRWMNAACAIRAAGLILAVGLAWPAIAGPREDAATAYSRQEYATTVRLLKPLADQGAAWAQTFLGFMYAYGEGVPKDDAQAVKWYRLAADQGDAMAQAALGLMYANGEGVPRDYVLAYMWLNLGAARGQ